MSQYMCLILAETLSTFASIRTVCLLQCKVENDLRNICFKRQDTKNANIMQIMAETVSEVLADAMKAKKKINL